MIKALISDFSRVLLFPKNRNYKDSLNSLHKELSVRTGYKILDYFELNNELLDYYRSLTGKLDLYIFTSETIQDAPDLRPFIRPVFKGVYSALKMRTSKKEEEAYKRLASTLGLAPREIIYIDDGQANVEAAKKAGFQTILYQDNESLKSELQTKLAE